MATDLPQRAPRRDAARNRARLVEAAASAFREAGLGVSVNAIARNAGVNVATLYRHFPTKDELVGAVLEAILEPLAAARDHALATENGALAGFLREALRLQSHHQGLVDALRQRPFSPDVRRRLRGLAIEIAEPVVARAHRDGELRHDLDTEDVLIALRMLGAVAESEGIRSKAADRYLDVVRRGLRPD